MLRWAGTLVMIGARLLIEFMITVKVVNGGQWRIYLILSKREPLNTG